MFAEELTGNASRKRAEENRNQRRKLKEQQQKVKAKATALPAPIAFNETRLSAPTIIDKASSSNLATPSLVSPSIPFLTAPKQSVVNVQPSAVQRANEQRIFRAEAALQQSATIKIQSLYRAHRSNMRLQSEQKELLTKRLHDLATLRSILLQKKSVNYVPPPATTTALVRQFIFLAKNIPYKSRAFLSLSSRLDSAALLELWEQLLESCIVPGMGSIDDNINPFVVWMESQHGRRRLEDILRLTLVALISSRQLSTTGWKNTLQFVRTAIGLHATDSIESTLKSSLSRMDLVKHCRSLILHRDSIVISRPTEPSKMLSIMVRGSTLDLVAILRYYLMFVVAGPYPIPSDAMDHQEKIFSEQRKTEAGELLLLILEFTDAAPVGSEQDHLRARIVNEILSVPLLLWKVSSACATQMVTKSSKNGKILFIRLIEAFVGLYRDALETGNIETILLDDHVPLKLCPATKSQCLLANMVQLVQACPFINSSEANSLDNKSAILAFSFIGTLLDSVPLGTFSSRDSSVEWITDGKGVHTPIVLSPIILDQCRLILLDSFVRRLFNRAVNLDALKTDNVLMERNEKDLKHEKDLSDEGASSAALLAAKEARIDRTKSFWNSSKWARKLTNRVTSMLAADTVKQKSDAGAGTLIDTSSESRKLASGNTDTCRSVALNGPESLTDKQTPSHYSPDFFFALCRTYSIILARWGGDGQSDIVRRLAVVSKGKGSESKKATAKPETCVLSLLNVLCFSTPIIKASWGVIQSHATVISDVYSIIDANKGETLIRALVVRPIYSLASTVNYSKYCRGDGAALLYMLTCTLAHVLIVTDDIELHDMGRPLPVHQLRRLIQVLKKLLFRACCLDDITATIESNYFGLALISSSSKTMRDLYDRSSRRPLCVPKLWLVTGLLDDELKRCKTHGDFVQLLSLPVLRVSPFLVSFKKRLKLFERIVTTNRIDIQGVNDVNPFNTNPLKPGIPVRITRGRLLEDGLATMNHLGSDMRRRIAVQYVNEAGTQETGIDAGGLFKEFWTDLSAIAFNPNYALFRVTDGAGNCLYPSPSSSAAHGSDHVVLFEFLGRILGKALYEGITIHPRFAHFFLSFLRGDYNFLHMLPDLSTIDPQLYNNLMFLKTYDGNAEDLCLSFTVTVDDFGGTTEVPLVPNGANVEVTDTNKQRYIGLVAKYYVFDRVKEQSEAFTRGLWEVIDRTWLRLFNEPELQVLISGASEKIDVDDMRANTKYAGGYTSIDRTIHRFWNVVASLDEKKQAELLRFVTSCERPPPLGFSSMNPPFTIQRVGILRDGGLLPTASTCFNTLKLPTYSSEKVLKERLLYAIQSGAGFELT